MAKLKAKSNGKFKITVTADELEMLGALVGQVHGLELDSLYAEIDQAYAPGCCAWKWDAVVNGSVVKLVKRRV